MAVNNNPRNPSGPVTPLKLKLGGSANNQMAPPASGAASGDQQAYLHYQQQQLKKLEEENMRIRKEQMEKRHQSNSGGGFGMAPVTAGGTSFVLDPETGMMVPVSGAGESESAQSSNKVP